MEGRHGDVDLNLALFADEHVLAFEIDFEFAVYDLSLHIANQRFVSLDFYALDVGADNVHCQCVGNPHTVKLAYLAGLYYRVVELHSIGSVKSLQAVTVAVSKKRVSAAANKNDVFMFFIVL
jgi:hypothetical protein